MLFKSPSIGTQYASLHPALRKALGETEATVTGWGLPEFTITEAVRTRAENAALYTAQYVSEGLAPSDAAKKAEHRFSYHLCSCAADFRSSAKPYSADEWDRIRFWMKSRYQRPMWEMLVHNAGTGIHGHLAICDFTWRRKWEQQTKSGGAA